MPAAPAAVLIDRFREIRTLPHIVARLTQLVNDQESTLQDFEAVIRTLESAAKSAAARANGKKGGRPRKEQ